MNNEGKSIKEMKREDYLKLIDLVGRKRADEIFEVMKTLTTAQNIRLEKLEILPSLPVSENT
jgi:hypothetical protein